jgi:hypothetical protein
MKTGLGNPATHSAIATGIILFLILCPSLAPAQASLYLKANSQPPKNATQPAKPPYPPATQIDCPAAGSLNIPIQEKPIPHPTVLLTWNANAPYPHAAGYCLYRSRTKGIPKRLSDCKDCQLVTEKSILGTGCIDDRVEEKATYYYVVTAATLNKSISLASNEATASVRLNDNPQAVPKSSYPFCRSK